VDLGVRATSIGFIATERSQGLHRREEKQGRRRIIAFKISLKMAEDRICDIEEDVALGSDGPVVTSISIGFTAIERSQGCHCREEK